MSNKDFQVNYRLNVQAGDGIEQLKQFTTAISGLARTQSELTGAASSINTMFATLNKTFKTGGKKNYTIGFNTKAGVTQLEKVLKVLDKISVKAKSMPLGFGSASIMTQGEFDNLMKRYEAEKRAMAQTKAAATQHASAVVRSSQTAVTALTQLNSVVRRTAGTMRSLNSGTSMVIKTDQAKSRLQEVLRLVQQIKREASGGATVGGRSLGAGAKQIGNSGWSYPNGYPTGGRNSWGKAYRQSGGYTQFTPITPNITPPPPPPPNNKKGGKGGKGGKGNVNNAALNRLHYSSMPTWRNLPFAGMLNAYFMYSAMKSELTDAIAFTHTVDAAKQVLMTTDNDLGTFATRFGSMMANVRQIGVDTRFTMVEMAKATQFMAQAGFSTDQINSAIRPISNLALIADTPIQDIADNITGILSGYRIDTDSTGSLSDQMAATYTRSKATISEMSESFKMSAGFLQMAGVDVSEAIAAFGVLGNANLRGTMAGTSVRSMMTFLAKPSKTSIKTLQRLGVETTEEKVVYGKTVRQLRSLADIFTDLKNAGASLQDMSAIFGKIGGTGAMILSSRSDELRELTGVNLASHGLAEKLGKAKQETTSGLWEQVTSQWSESFTQVFEAIEPRIKTVLQNLTQTLSTDSFTAGLKSFGEAMLTVFDIASKVGTWTMKNWSWIEPLFITGMAAKAIFSAAGAMANMAVAIRGVGAASAAAGVAQTAGKLGTLGANMGSAINTGRGLTGTIASLGAIGATATIAAAGVALIGGAIAYAGYSWYQLESKRESFEKEMQETGKYSFPSIDALTESLHKARDAAEGAKIATDSLLSEATVDERYDNVTQSGGIWDITKRLVTSSIPKAFFEFDDFIGGGALGGTREKIKQLRLQGKVEEADAMEADMLVFRTGGEDSSVRSRLANIAIKAANKSSAVAGAEAMAFLAKNPTVTQAKGALDLLNSSLTIPESSVNKDLYYKTSDGKYHFKDDLLENKSYDERRTFEYVANMAENKNSGKFHTPILTAMNALANTEYARNLVFGDRASEYKDKFLSMGYKLVDGKLVREKLSKNATEEEKVTYHKNQKLASGEMYRLMTVLKSTFGDDGRVSRAILENTGLAPTDALDNNVVGDNSYINPSNYSNSSMAEMDTGGSGLGGAGRSYGGSGKLSTVAPKQVNVNITNLMSIETIQLMNSEEGQNPQMQDLKGSLTQLLLEVVHDFDSSWNA